MPCPLRRTVSLLALALFATALPVRARQDAPFVEGRYLVERASDGAAHARFLRRLGHLRTTGQRDAFEDALERRRLALRAGQRELADAVVAAGGRVERSLWLIDALVVTELGRDAARSLASRADVRAVHAGRAALPQVGSALDAAHHDALAVHAMMQDGLPLQGGGVVVAIVDSGADLDHAGSGRPHAAYYPGGDPVAAIGKGIAGSRILSAQDLEVADGSVNPEDVFGHGTRMGSILAGAKFNALPNVSDGMAPEVELRAYKISHDGMSGGQGSTVNMAVAFDALAAEFDVRVANMSYFGSPGPLQLPEPAMDAAVLTGIHVAVAGGNSGSNLSSAHGAYNVVAAGGSADATKEPFVDPSFWVSAIGPLNGRRYPHLLGLGEALTCAKIDDEASSIDSCCTSGAAALISGAAALVTQAVPTLDALEVRALLLNTSLEVTLGNPDAAGYGYLHAKRAIDAALAGEVVREGLGAGQRKVHDWPLVAGEEAAVTLVWNRDDVSLGVPPRLDLVVRDPGGQVLADLSGGLDNTKQLRFQPGVTGVHSVEVSATSLTSTSAIYALAGVSTPSVDDGTGCPGGAPTLTAVAPAQVPAVGAAAPVVVDGCNLVGVVSVRLGGAEALAFEELDPGTLRVELPASPALGAVPLRVETVGGASSIDLLVVEPAPGLELSADFVVTGDAASVTLAGAAHELAVLCTSFDATPSICPGLVNLDIGAGLTSLEVWPPLSLAPAGWRVVELGVVQGGLPPLTDVHFQAILIDPAQPGVGWHVTPTDTVTIFF